MRHILNHRVVPPGLLLGVLEATLVATGCYVTIFFGYPIPSAGGSFGSLLLYVFVLSFGVFGLMHSGGLYGGHVLFDLKQSLWRVAALAIPIFAVAVLTTGELAEHSGVPIYPYRWQWTLAFTAFWLASILACRLAFRAILARRLLPRMVLFLGIPKLRTDLQEIAALTNNRFRLVELSVRDLQQSSQDRRINALQRPCSDAAEIVVSRESHELFGQELALCRSAGLHITDYADFCERESHRIAIDSIGEDWATRSTRFSSETLEADWVRRLLDGFLSAVALIAVAPVLLLTALAIKLEDGGPVFYKQERVGLRDCPFMIFKFRSMRDNAESDGVPAWATERDSRITKVGRFLRKLRIDELPQFANVLLGNMSIVGPRPERPYFVEQFSQSIPNYRYRHLVRPGITGWAQVSFRYGASLQDTKQKLSYDLYYIKHQSFLFDVFILLKTVGVVLRGEGAR